MIVGTIGRAGAGKDFTYTYLRANSTRDVTRRAFADQLKYEIEDVLNGGVRMPVIWDKPYPDEVRRLLQFWGTDLRRAQDPDYWLKKAERALDTYAAGEDLTVVTDVRFPNEADLIRKMGGLLIRLWVPDKVRLERLGGVLPPEHISETALDAYVADIVLDSSIDGYLTPMVGAGKWYGLLRTHKGA